MVSAYLEAVEYLLAMGLGEDKTFEMEAKEGGEELVISLGVDHDQLCGDWERERI